ncbi:hypothetical protein [Cryobacterium sp. BB307]|uniref:hypothetical protein n=1 Tax=Cryobacterium sp. BB307 TaxID=2716317 RepID=UPI0014461490|nr:hypothetical protein [Cryobacterium sp. BB307]
MKPPSHDDTRERPLTNPIEIENRVTELLVHANQRQLWLMFLDDEQVQLPLLIPVDSLPGELTEDDARAFALAIGDTARNLDAASVLIVLEELHDGQLTDRDRAWARLLHAACDAQGTVVRGILLCHMRGVRWMPQDDYRW